MSRRCVLSRAVEESELSSLGEKRKDARVERRIVALRLIASGQLSKDVASIVGVNERTIRVWVKDFNREGVASLRYDTKKGSRPHLSVDNERELIEAIRQGPPAEMKLGVWRGWALRDWIRDRFGVEYSESGVYFLLHRLGFSSLMPRPLHPESDESVRDDFKKNISGRRTRFD